MKTYVLMSKLAPHGPSVVEVVSSVKDGPKSRRLWIEQVKKQCPEVKFTAHYALLGAWETGLSSMRPDIARHRNRWHFGHIGSLVCAQTGHVVWRSR